MKRTAIVNMLILLCAVPLSVASILYVTNQNVGEATARHVLRFTLSPFVAKVLWGNGLDGAVLAVPFVLLVLGATLATLKSMRVTSHVLACLVTALWIFIVWVDLFVTLGP